MTNGKNADAAPSLTFTSALNNANPNLVEDDNEGEVNGGSCEGGQQARLGEQLILPGQPARNGNRRKDDVSSKKKS
jgi:hypothetical protein